MTDSPWPEWTPSERRESLWAALLLMALTALLPGLAWADAYATHRVWSGAGYLAPDDIAVYLSYIRQAAEGAVWLENRFTTEPTTPTLNVLWWSVGQLARVTRASPLLAFHVARTVLIAPLAFTVSWSVAQFTPDRLQRRVALWLILFGSGVGAWVAWSGAGESVTDLWVGESHAFLSAGFSPHFVASWILLILALTWGWRAVHTSSRRDAGRCGGAAALLFQFHPFYVPVLALVVVAWALDHPDGVRRWRERGPVLLIIAALALPAVMYHVWLLVATPNRQFMLGANVLETPPAPLVILGLLGLLVFGYLGARMPAPVGGEAATRKRAATLWALVHGALVYAPFTFQRRLLEGLPVPLAVLSSVALVAMWRRVNGTGERRAIRWIGRAVASILLVALFAPSTVYHLVHGAQYLRTNWRDLQLLPTAEADALHWLSDRTPDDAIVLSGYRSGNVIAGWTGRRVVVGHWNNTIDWRRKQADAQQFMAAASDSVRKRVLRATGATHVWIGPRERAWGTRGETSRALVPVYRTGTGTQRITIYAVRR